MDKLEILKTVFPSATSVCDPAIYAELDNKDIEKVVQRLAFMHKAYQLISELEFLANMKPKEVEAAVEEDLKVEA